MLLGDRHAWKYAGSTLNVDGNRQSAADRAIERLNGMDAQKLRQEATEEISGNN